MEVVHGTIPLAYFEPVSSVTASEVAAYILDSLYKRLDEACLVQGGEVLFFYLDSLSLIFSVFLFVVSLLEALTEVKRNANYRRKLTRCYSIYLSEVCCHT